jgi:hypothetical protein
MRAVRFLAFRLSSAAPEAKRHSEKPCPDDQSMNLSAEDYLLDFFSAFAAFFSFMVFDGFFFVSFF